MSRFRPLSLIVALVALAALISACGGGGGESDKADADPKTVINEATLKGVTSGNLDLSVQVDAEGDEGGNIDLSLSGPFEAQSEEEIPQLDLTASAEGTMGDEDINFDGGLVLLKDRGFVSYEGTDYEVDPTSFNFLKSALDQAQKEQSTQGAIACQQAATRLEVSDFIAKAANDGSVDVEGETTTQISGELDLGGAVGAIVALLKDPACKAQLGETGQLPSGAELELAKTQLEQFIEEAQIEVNVGDDGIIRRINANLVIEPPQESEGVERVSLDFDMTLSGVNEAQEIEGPSDAEPINDLLEKLDINPLEALGALNEGGLGGLGGDQPSGSGGDQPSGSGGDQAAYLECIGKANSSADLEKCSALLK